MAGPRACGGLGAETPAETSGNSRGRDRTRRLVGWRGRWIGTFRWGDLTIPIEKKRCRNVQRCPGGCCLAGKHPKLGYWEKHPGASSRRSRMAAALGVGGLGIGGVVQAEEASVRRSRTAAALGVGGLGVVETEQDGGGARRRRPRRWRRHRGGAGRRQRSASEASASEASSRSVRSKAFSVHFAASKSTTITSCRYKIDYWTISKPVDQQKRPLILSHGVFFFVFHLGAVLGIGSM
ncbi:hypothetical protein E2562_021394 [Oryza meyeriana var. granulata]|uniref:Uncharacterized protein n=1 Tax=Oryza meyeriana var. granulata TaxID=110450 RepID=A0A6G1EXK1_9ORYZ|nr:hypothetical protein E2562_021394 [Oryza meyeriana var. granulata]